MQDSALSLLPPLIAIIIAIVKRNAIVALLSGVFMCFWMIASWDVIQGLITTTTGILNVFSSTGNTRIVIFSLLIGALVELMNRSGAVNGFIDNLSKLSLVKTKRQAALLPTFVGTSIFTDTNLSMFSAGMASQKLFDSHKMSRAKLAYLIDSTCAPISILFLVNGWGAYVLGLLNDYDLTEPTGVLIGTIGYNFYAIIAVLFAYFTAYSGRVFGPMAQAEKVAQSQLANLQNVSQGEQKLASGQSPFQAHSQADEQVSKASEASKATAETSNTTESTEFEDDFSNDKKAKARVMWIPMFCLLAITFLLLWFSGDGDIRRGSGSFSVFWAIISSLVILLGLIAFYRLLSFKDVVKGSYQGVRKMAPAVFILVLSFAFGDGIKQLGTGTYISQLLAVDFYYVLIAPAIFIAAALMAFSTGTSWGTFATLIPIAIPISMTTALPPEFLVAAVLSGGIFGDHASPISDTTIVASIASGCDHFEHVKTQLPYALFAGVLSLIAFVITGYILQ